jgi:hypothetical protein
VDVAAPDFIPQGHRPILQDRKTPLGRDQSLK